MKYIYLYKTVTHYGFSVTEGKYAVGAKINNCCEVREVVTCHVDNERNRYYANAILSKSRSIEHYKRLIELNDHLFRD